jgi:hypothetical protein
MAQDQTSSSSSSRRRSGRSTPASKKPSEATATEATDASAAPADAAVTEQEAVTPPEAPVEPSALEAAGAEDPALSDDDLADIAQSEPMLAVSEYLASPAFVNPDDPPRSADLVGAFHDAGIGKDGTLTPSQARQFLAHHLGRPVETDAEENVEDVPAPDAPSEEEVADDGEEHETPTTTEEQE